MTSETQQAPELKPGDYPKILPSDVSAAIVDETYTLLPNGRTTVCQLTLKNGFTVEGMSSVVDIRNFDEKLGQQVAKANAINNVFLVLGYHLMEQVHQSKGNLPTLTKVIN
jgi:hypothetical protein